MPKRAHISGLYLVTPEPDDDPAALLAVTEAGLAAARPGATAGDLHAAMWRVLQSHGARGEGDVGRGGEGVDLAV